MQSKTCVVSVAFRNPYVLHMDKLLRCLNEDVANVDTIFFRDKLPMKGIVHEDNIVTHFQKSLYGFKPHAIQRAIDRGYKKVIWLDPSVLPTVSMQVLIDALDKHPMINVIGDAPITKMCNSKAKNWFEVNDAELEGVKHLGGTIYGFNFNNSQVRDTFNLWIEAEQAGMFGDQDEFMAGHWADEACMALAMYKNNIKPHAVELFTYYNMKNGI